MHDGRHRGGAVTNLLSHPIPPIGPGEQGGRSSLVLAAHRGPLRFSENAVVRNAGGLVTALEALVQEVSGDVRWICAPASQQDLAMAASGRWIPFETGGATCQVRMLDLDRAAHADFYNVIANPLLWFVQHDLYRDRLYRDRPPVITDRERRTWRDGYVAVNRQFATSLADAAVTPPDGVVMVHDYHFYLVPGMLRPLRPDIFIHHFTHIPWPRPRAWQVLPDSMVDAVFRGLLGSDIVGFHTERDVRNFLVGCEELLGLSVDFDHGSVCVDDRTVAVRHYPISINVEALQTLAATPEVAARGVALREHRAEKVILRVDRADPSKNIVRGFEAFALMLADHPWLRGRVEFLALLQPTRPDVPEYAEYMLRIQQTVDAVNAEFGRDGWLPIDLRLVEDLPLAVAAYKRFDVLLVNSLADGMNLVVKEAVVVNETDGVVVLSKSAGAHDELEAAVSSIDPLDVAGQADALYEGLVMPRPERRARLAVAADIVKANDMQKWLRYQLGDIELARSTPRSTVARA